ncbi:hypothetical protein N0V88_002579 [Collariella sp. IMI 366227]|nr:hypothetical protein N0V88_002579 [Collariella sp. IMI 366227]
MSWIDPALRFTRAVPFQPAQPGAIRPVTATIKRDVNVKEGHPFKELEIKIANSLIAPLNWTGKEIDFSASQASEDLLTRTHNTATPWFTRQILQDAADAFKRWKQQDDRPLVLIDLVGRKLEITKACEFRPCLHYRPIPTLLPITGEHDQLLPTTVAYIVPPAKEFYRSRRAPTKVEKREALQALCIADNKLAAALSKIRLVLSELAGSILAPDASKIVVFGSNRTISEGDPRIKPRTSRIIMTEALQIEILNHLRFFLSSRLGQQADDIQTLIQSNGYTEREAVEYPLYKGRGCLRLVNDPVGFLEVNRKTVVVSLDVDLPVRQVVLDIARPAAIICQRLTDADAAPNIDRLDPATPQVIRVLRGEYHEVVLPDWETEHGVRQMAVYVRKAVA